MKKLLSLTLAGAMALSLAACSNSASSASAESSVASSETSSAEDSAAAPGESYTLSFACTVSNTSPSAMLFEEALAQITERTNGAITFNTSYSGALGNEHDLGVNIVDGAIDLALVGPGEWASYDPAFYVLDTPFLYDDQDHFKTVLDSDFYKEFLKTKGDEIGFEVLVTLDQGIKGIINSKRPVYSPADLAGLKIRVPDSDSLIRVQAALGGTPSPIAASEQYTSISQGIIDGADHSLSAHVAWQLYDYAKYFTETNHALQTSYYVISKATMEKLPEEYQTIIREVMAEQEQAQYALAIEQAEADEQTFLDNGGEIVRNADVDVEAFRENCADIIAEFSAYDSTLYDSIRAAA